MLNRVGKGCALRVGEIGGASGEPAATWTTPALRCWPTPAPPTRSLLLGKRQAGRKRPSLVQQSLEAKALPRGVPWPGGKAVIGVFREGSPVEREWRGPLLDETEAREGHLPGGGTVLEEQVGHLHRAADAFNDVRPGLCRHPVSCTEEQPLLGLAGRPLQIDPAIGGKLDRVVDGWPPARAIGPSGVDGCRQDGFTGGLLPARLGSPGPRRAG